MSFIEICQVNYLNNLVEQEHRFVKKITKSMMGFKAFYSVQATIDGIEITYMIRMVQLSEENISANKQFMALVWQYNFVYNVGVIYIRLNSEKESVKQEAGKNQVGRIQIYYLYIEAYHAL